MQLRCKGVQSWPPTPLPANSRLPIDGLSGQAFDIELVLHRGSSFVAGLMLQSWNSGAGSAAILYDFDNSLLEVRPRSRLAHISAWKSRGSALKLGVLRTRQNAAYLLDGCMCVACLPPEDKHYLRRILTSCLPTST